MILRVWSDGGHSLPFWPSNKLITSYFWIFLGNVYDYFPVRLKVVSCDLSVRPGREDRCFGEIFPVILQCMRHGHSHHSHLYQRNLRKALTNWWYILFLTAVSQCMSKKYKYFGYKWYFAREDDICLLFFQGTQLLSHALHHLKVMWGLSGVR